MKRPRLVKLKRPVGDGDMAERLLWILGEVRRGRVMGYCICLVTDAEKGSATFEHASADGDDGIEVHLLGAMRLAEHDLIERRRQREEDAE